MAVKPHASPVFHSIQYLMGLQSREKLENFRGYGGAQSYPSRTKDIDDVDFSTGSVGLGVAITAFASIVQDYLAAEKLDEPAPRRPHDCAGGRCRAGRGQYLRVPAGGLEARSAQYLVDHRLQPPEPRRRCARRALAADRGDFSGVRLGGGASQIRCLAAGRVCGTRRRGSQGVDRPLSEPALFGAHLPRGSCLACPAARRNWRPGGGDRSSG